MAARIADLGGPSSQRHSARGEIAGYVNAVRAACGAPYSVAGKLARVEQAAAELFATSTQLADHLTRLGPRPDGHYGRHLLHRDGRYGFVVVGMVWPAGFHGPPHDHGTWGVVLAVDGQVAVTTYRRDDDGRDPERAELSETAALVAGPGATSHVLPPHDDVHAVGNASQRDLAITLHTYGREVPRCRVFDLESGRVSWTTPTYD